MLILVFSLACAALAARSIMRRRTRKGQDSRGKTGPLKPGPAREERNAARVRIVVEADRLCELEEALGRFGEGTDPAISPDEAERKRTEASRLRTRLEAECQRHGFPLGLVRRRRMTRHIPTVAPLDRR